MVLAHCNLPNPGCASPFTENLMVRLFYLNGDIGSKISIKMTLLNSVKFSPGLKTKPLALMVNGLKLYRGRNGESPGDQNKEKVSGRWNDIASTC